MVAPAWTFCSYLFCTITRALMSVSSWNGFTTRAVGEMRDIAKKGYFDAGTANAARKSVEDDLSQAGARPSPFLDGDRRGGRSDQGQASQREAVVPTNPLRASASASVDTAPRAAAGLPFLCLTYAPRHSLVSVGGSPQKRFAKKK